MPGRFVYLAVSARDIEQRPAAETVLIIQVDDGTLEIPWYEGCPSFRQAILDWARVQPLWNQQ